MVGYINFNIPDAVRKEREARTKLANERNNIPPAKEFGQIKAIQEAEKLEQLRKFEYIDPQPEVGFGEKSYPISDDGLKELEADQQTRRKLGISELPKKKVESDSLTDVWVGEKTAKELDLSEYVNEEKFEKLTDFKLDEIREGKDKLVALSEEDKRQIEKLRKDYAGNKEWRAFVRKAEEKLDYLIKVSPEQVQFVVQGY